MRRVRDSSVLEDKLGGGPSKVSESEAVWPH